MGDTDRVIGALMEFKNATENRLNRIEDQNTRRFDGLDREIKKLNQFKWRMAGGAAVLSVILAAVIKFIEVVAIH